MDIYSCFKSFFEKYRTRMREFFTGGIELGASEWNLGVLMAEILVVVEMG
jgi:hypothetical protein